MTLTPTITGSVRPQLTADTIPVDITVLLSLIQDPAAFGAPGTIDSDGTISLSGKSSELIFSDSGSFLEGQGLYIEGTSPGLPGTFVTTIQSIISTSTSSITLAVAGTPAVSLTAVTVQNDDAPSINLAIANGAALAGNGGYFQVNGGGRTYSLASSITLQSGLNLQDFRFTVMPSPKWVGGASGTPASNGVIAIPAGAYNVVCRNIYIDINRVLNVNGIVNNALANILIDNCHVTHWAGNGIGFYNTGKCSVANCAFGQWGAANPEANTPAYSNSGYALYEAGSDSSYSQTDFIQGYRPVYIASNAHNIRFDTCHTFPMFAQTPVATFLGSISGTILTVSDLDYGTIADGQVVFWAGTTIGSTIQSALTMSSNQYLITPSSSATLQSMTAIQLASFDASFSGTTLTVIDLESGGIFAGETLAFTGAAPDTYIMSQLSGTPGKLGTYLLSNSPTISSGPVIATTPISNFVGSISGTTLTAGTPSYGTIVPGQNIFGANVANGTMILSGPSAGGAGSYQVNISQTVPSNTQMTGYQVQAAASIFGSITGTLGSGDGTLTAQTITSGNLLPGMTLYGSGVTSGTVILSGPAGGGTGTYVVNLGTTTAVPSDTPMTALLPEGFANFEIHGNAIAITDHYLDSGNILIVNSTGRQSPSVVVGIGMTIYNSMVAPYSSSHVVASTAVYETSLDNVIISPDSVFDGGLPILSLKSFVAGGTVSTTAGSWIDFQTSIQVAQLEAQQQSMLTTNGGLLIAETTQAEVVATLMGNSSSGASMAFIDGSTTLTPTPQVGSDGNDIVLSYNGTVAFRGSAMNESAIIGNSMAGQTFATHTVLSSKTGVPALQAINSATPDPQGYTVNFTEAAPNNKTDPAFGFQDTLSSSFKTAIWSDGSVAHPAFGFNVSEFDSVQVSSTTMTVYQIASSVATGKLLAGTYELEWNSSVAGNRLQHMIVAIGYDGNDTAGLITVLHNYCREGVVTISNPTLMMDSSKNAYFVVTLTPNVEPGTFSVQARGYFTGVGITTTLGGTTAATGTQVATVNQTGGPTVLSYLSEAAASSNTVTNKIEVVIGTTTYYLLASTSPT